MTGGARVSSGSDSRQTYSTPRDFVRAVERRIGAPFAWDLAADASNAVCQQYLGLDRPGYESLTFDWATLAPGRWLWLNPPFADIAPWARKCEEAARRGAKIAFLVPAAVGSLWYAHHVHGKAHVLFPRPRLSFDGKNPYPKDVLLALYGAHPLVDCWDWKAEP